jgi:hypothetical protein
VGVKTRVREGIQTRKLGLGDPAGPSHGNPTSWMASGGGGGEGGQG